jgi:Fe-Mn family superoxide dismutase
MNTTNLTISLISFLLVLSSCNDKKLIEVVDVPLPTAQKAAPIANPQDVKADPGPFELAPLPYSYNALEPNIDAKTMEIHYSKHYLTYTNNLNKAIIGTKFEKLAIQEILSKAIIDTTGIRNNAGGYYNHTLFWECIGPKKNASMPKDTLASAINAEFGSFENFKSKFKNTATKHFGSGWAWLIVDSMGKLQIVSTNNQENPLMPNSIIEGTPILALDLWEHAYYLKYQYKRKDYIEAFFNVINWENVTKKYESAIQ